ncbi:unnamed protein product [Linum tenue]|uniref:Red chlorophyll catabolite reductase n=1 Tax=Linum tenue TaxID=586396 RepID=A0AAV0R7G1_9ROSI|nr:unnamed protein product [Linum tenue]
MAVRITTTATSFFTVTAPSSSPFPSKPLPLLTSFPSHPRSSYSSPATKTTSLAALSSPSSQMSDDGGRRKFMDFPFAAGPIRDAMVDLVSTVENRLASHLLPPALPPDVQYCRNDPGTAHASLHIRSGHNSSPVDFILGSWLHCKLPTGNGSLNITSLSAYLNTSTDAPNLLIELIQSSPDSLIFILDLPPRKDPVFHPEYLQEFYEETKLDSHRQVLEKLPEVRPYFSSSLYLRSILSPTAIIVRIDGGEQAGRVEEIVKECVHPVAKEVVGIWLEKCAMEKRELGEDELTCLKKRDGLIKSKTIEIDLGSNFPRLFGPEVSERLLGAVRVYYNV